MNVIKKELGKLVELTPEKIREYCKSEEKGDIILGHVSYHAMNKYYFVNGDVDIRGVLILAKIVGYSEEDDKMDVAWQEYTFSKKAKETFTEHEKNKGHLFHEKLSELSTTYYEIPANVISMLGPGTPDIMVDDDNNLYIEIYEHDVIYALIGEYKKFNAKSHRKGKEVNGLFFEKSSAERFAKMLRGYGRINNIEYVGFEIKDYAVI